MQKKYDLENYDPFCCTLVVYHVPIRHNGTIKVAWQQALDTDHEPKDFPGSSVSRYDKEFWTRKAQATIFIVIISFH